MSKIALLQPNADECYGHRQGYASSIRPPETGLAVLSSYITTKAPSHEVVCLDPNRTDREIALEASNCDVFGLTDWFSNHKRVIDIAEKTKKLNDRTVIVVGGPNVPGLASLLLQKYPFVDYAVERDGEDTFLGLANGVSIKQLPNLWYRDNGVQFTKPGFTNLKELPLWNFDCFQALEDRLSEYQQAIAIKGSQDFDPWLVPPVTMFSFRGCMKAVKQGVCSYCTSAETRGRALPPDKFWQQIALLENRYGASVLYEADDIFPVSVQRMEQIAQAKPSQVKTPSIRAYAYMPDFIELDESKIKRMIAALKTIGVFNLFFGVESYGIEQITKANKVAVSIEDSDRVIRQLGEAGIKTTMAYLLGLPGETQQSLQKNINSLEILLGGGFVERVYLSIVMALRGTPLFEQISRHPRINAEYLEQTGKDLATDDYPDYSQLQRLSVRHLTGIAPIEINDWLSRMIITCERYLPAHRVGGFLLKSI